MSMSLPTTIKGCFVGSGSDGLNDALVCETIIGQTGKAAPVVLYLGTATYDLAGPRSRQTERFVAAGCTCTTIDLAGDTSTWPSAEEMATLVGACDIIIVSGGNTLWAIDRFHTAGLTPLLRDAMGRGAVLAGGSAGAICWFDAGHSDSMDPDSYKAAMLGAEDTGKDESGGAFAGEAKPWEYVRVACLGFLPGLVCPHYDKVQSNGVLRATDFDGMMLDHAGETGIGIDHWAALLVDGADYAVLSLPGKPGSVLPDGTHSPEQAGVPGCWELHVVGEGVVERKVIPSKGKLSDLLKHATEIVPDERCDVSRRDNPQ